MCGNLFRLFSMFVRDFIPATIALLASGNPIAGGERKDLSVQFITNRSVTPFTANGYWKDQLLYDGG